MRNKNQPRDVWGFPKMGVALNHPFFNGWGTPIYGTPIYVAMSHFESKASYLRELETSCLSEVQPISPSKTIV